jgi:hypothetical protein
VAGRSIDWLKIKCSNSESFVVIGYEPSLLVRGSIASLLLAARKNDGLVYVGHVGTGFSTKLARDLRVPPDGMRVAVPAASGISGKKYVFVEPTLVAEISCGSWRRDGKLHHPSFKGLRGVADSAESTRWTGTNHFNRSLGNVVRQALITTLATEARRNLTHPFGKLRGEPHLLLTIEAHALGADHSATGSAPGLLSYCVSGRSGHPAIAPTENATDALYPNHPSRAHRFGWASGSGRCRDCCRGYG